MRPGLLEASVTVSLPNQLFDVDHIRYARILGAGEPTVGAAHGRPQPELANLEPKMILKSW